MATAFYRSRVAVEVGRPDAWGAGLARVRDRPQAFAASAHHRLHFERPPGTLDGVSATGGFVERNSAEALPRREWGVRSARALVRIGIMTPEPKPTIVVPCNLCKSTECSVLFPAGVAQVNQIVRCNHCGFMYASPRKEADHVEIEAWPDDPAWEYETHYPLSFEKQRLQVRDYRDTRTLLSKLHPTRGKLLEVGSCLGFLLDFFRRDGWDVLGVEPDRYGCRHAAGKLGIEVVNSTLEDAKLPSDSVDVVLMMHVIEHVPDPLGSLREINRILKPGGHLVLETPRYDTLMFKLLGRRERSVSCDGHIFFYTVDTLRRAYETAGFELERLDYPPRSLTLERVAYNLGVVSKSPTIQSLLGSMARRLGLHKVWVQLNFRDMQRVCLRKVTRTEANTSGRPLPTIG